MGSTMAGKSYIERLNKARDAEDIIELLDSIYYSDKYTSEQYVEAATDSIANYINKRDLEDIVDLLDQLVQSLHQLFYKKSVKLAISKFGEIAELEILACSVANWEECEENDMVPLGLSAEIFLKAAWKGKKIDELIELAEAANFCGGGQPDLAYDIVLEAVGMACSKFDIDYLKDWINKNEWENRWHIDKAWLLTRIESKEKEILSATKSK
jgi:hypothetical protein